MKANEIIVVAILGSAATLALLAVVSKSFRADVKADEELFMARVHGFEMRITSTPRRIRARWVAAIAGFRAGWKSISAAPAAKN